MKWPSRKKKEADDRVNLTKTEAVQAVLEAQHRLKETKALWPEIKALTDKLAYIRERNHLSEAIERAVLGDQH
jgi:hypothetical protein